jgi:ESCRT-II complex subunit VPS36
MGQAREVIAVVQRYAVLMADKTNKANISETDSTSDAMSENSSQVAETNEMESILQSIGIVSPITKSTAGRSYHQQLARQIADILLAQQRLQRLGGIITLTDLYCLFNRARGTALISPDDLLAATKSMNTLSLGMCFKSLPSGVKVLQLDNYSEEKTAQRMVDLIASSPELQSHGVSVFDVAMHLGMSLVLAKEQVFYAEQMGVLCRDESIQGLQFFPNLFALSMSM